MGPLGDCEYLAGHQAKMGFNRTAGYPFRHTDGDGMFRGRNDCQCFSSFVARSANSNCFEATNDTVLNVSREHAIRTIANNVFGDCTTSFLRYDDSWKPQETQESVKNMQGATRDALKSLEELLPHIKNMNRNFIDQDSGYAMLEAVRSTDSLIKKLAQKYDDFQFTSSKLTRLISVINSTLKDR